MSVAPPDAAPVTARTDAAMTAAAPLRLDPALGWRARLQAFSNGLVANPRFRRHAARFPLTRPIARQRARAVFDLVSGFVYSQVLLACVQLGLLERLRVGPQPIAALARAADLPPEAMQRLIDAAIALRLLAPAGPAAVQLGALGAPIAGDDGIRALIAHHALFYADLADPVALLRNGARPDGALARFWPYCANREREGHAPDVAAAYSALMASSQTLIAEQVLDAVSLRRHRRVLDVGGGEGAFLGAALARWPALQGFLFDLPPVAERARARFAASGLAARTVAVGGSFLDDPLPQGADLVTLIRVLHDHDDASVRTLLRAVRRALPRDGRVLVAEPLAATPGAETVGDAYFGFYLLAMGRGRPRSAETIAALLVEAGFAAPRRVPTSMPLQTSVLVAAVGP